jgi:NYN domain
MIRREAGRPFLSAVFVDYDNIYLSLKRKNEEVAKRFARDAVLWTKAIESGALITSTNGPSTSEQRRIVMNRCYGNPVPRRNQTDNSTDMNSFPFVRHHFLRAGFEIIDCPPLTAQLKNSSDIRMVMDVVDHLAHGTYFDEFVILSGDADFTPVLHRLRAHARRTVIFANDYTAAPYTAISDGEVRESDLISLLLDFHGEAGATSAPSIAPQAKAAPLSEADRAALRHEIIADVIEAVQAAPAPVPLEVLADRAVRTIGHDRTVATAWAGAGGFRELLAQTLPDDMRLSDQPPYLVIDTRRHLPAARAAQLPELPDLGPIPSRSPIAAQSAPLQVGRSARETPSHDHYDDFRPERALPSPSAFGASPTVAAAQPLGSSPRYGQGESISREDASRELALGDHAHREMGQRNPAPRTPTPPNFGTPQPTVSTPPARPAAQSAAMPSQTAAAAPTSRAKEATSTIQQSIARIHEACQAPPLAPPEYRALFEVMALEINENNLLGAQTIQNVLRRAQEHGLELRKDDVRFVMDVVSEADPWFEQGASANLFAGRFRNFVVARCRGQGLKLSADELDLIEAWFVGNGAPTSARAAAAAPAYTPPQNDAARAGAPIPPGGAAPTADEFASDEFPRIVRTRLRG